MSVDIFRKWRDLRSYSHSLIPAGISLLHGFQKPVYSLWLPQYRSAEASFKQVGIY